MSPVTEWGCTSKCGRMTDVAQEHRQSRQSQLPFSNLRGQSKVAISVNDLHMIDVPAMLDCQRVTTRKNKKNPIIERSPVLAKHQRSIGQSSTTLNKLLTDHYQPATSWWLLDHYHPWDDKPINNPSHQPINEPWITSHPSSNLATIINHYQPFRTSPSTTDPPLLTWVCAKS